MSNMNVDKFLRTLAHAPNATDEIKEQYIAHVKQQRIRRKRRTENCEIYEQDKDALKSILEYRMQMVAITTCVSDESIIKAAQVIISLIDNSLEGTFCGSGDAKSLNIMLAAFELIKMASISGGIKTTEEATRAENLILRKAIEEGHFEILSQNGTLIKIKTYVDAANNVFCLPKWYFNSLLDDGTYFSKGKKFSGGKKGKKDCFRIALADDWLSRYREQRKYFEKHDATADANAFIHQHWDVEKYGNEVKNPQIAKIVKERLQETEQNLD